MNGNGTWLRALLESHTDLGWDQRIVVVVVVGRGAFIAMRLNSLLFFMDTTSRILSVVSP